MRFEKTLMASALTAALVVPTAASADELSDLKAQMNELMNRIETLEAMERTEHSDPAHAGQSTRATGRPAVNGDGAADWKPTIISGNDKVRVSLSGHINRAVMAYDDGENSDVHHVDNENSNTRFRIIGEYDASDTFSVGSVIEVEFESNSSSDVFQNSRESDHSENNFAQRKFEIYFADKGWGKLSLGQGDTASNGTSEVDLSGTGLAGYSSVGDVGSRLRFYDKNSNGFVSDSTDLVVISDGFTNMDGLSRQDRIRYDTPAIAGFTFSVSHAEDDGLDAAVRYKGDLGGLKVAGALAFADNQSDSPIDNQVNGSISVAMDNGFNLTFASGQQDRKRGSGDPQFYYTKLGYKMGASAYSVDYYSSDDVSANGNEGTSMGFQYVRNITEWATEAYFQLRQFEMEDNRSTDYDDIWHVMAGARVKF
ncbi:porin [Motiliproteus sp. SC1-56]|uniref:porin n=1 Tax=Motiliproteus sp. SC1-56 TaxID=2799565 RepID=UPI001A8FFE7E|nr:porin [Motiliproteus sp. SC1-56]